MTSTGSFHMNKPALDGEYRRICEITENIGGILNQISDIYQEINSSPIFKGTAAAAYERTFEELKRNAFDVVPKKIEDINFLMKQAKDKYVAVEEEMANAANVGR